MAVPASAEQRELAFEKNWRGMMAPSPSTSGAEDPREGGGGGSSGGGETAWHPPRSSFLSHTYTRRPQHYTGVPGPPKAQLGFHAHVPRTPRSRGRGGAFAQSFQRIRRRDADALPRLRYLSRHDAAATTAAAAAAARTLLSRRQSMQRLCWPKGLIESPQLASGTSPGCTHEILLSRMWTEATYTWQAKRRALCANAHESADG
ncbi:hypothetical protein G5I_04280 [Acromyrmex echinatior]|uniref:Uncharacterized protein n=1 Tax=Acromyrmex echinatior TaxID=103372 RepID=F4WF73_ACREC|nr:hypothetical protein G5I_04280 [Acromyrmex echinatior]